MCRQDGGSSSPISTGVDPCHCILEAKKCGGGPGECEGPLAEKAGVDVKSGDEGGPSF